MAVALRPAEAGGVFVAVAVMLRTSRKGGKMERRQGGKNFRGSNRRIVGVPMAIGGRLGRARVG
jgi:hypothetical protein